MLQLVLDHCLEHNLDPGEVHPKGEEAMAVWEAYLRWSLLRRAWVGAVGIAMTRPKVEKEEHPARTHRRTNT
jgi:hypothetical protein